MIIKSSKAIRNSYKDISTLCKTTNEPVHLTVNGEGDLVVMAIDAFYRRERQLDIREQLLAVEADRIRGVPDHPISAVIVEGRTMLKGITGDTVEE